MLISVIHVALIGRKGVVYGQLNCSDHMEGGKEGGVRVREERGYIILL